MNIDDIVKIGEALKWRGVYDPNKKYYRENIVTACGSVFRCKVLLSQGEPPFHVIDEDGTIEFFNPDIWDVLVDALSFYNFAVESNALSKKTWEYIELVEQTVEQQQEEIKRINQTDADQQKQINSLIEGQKAHSDTLTNIGKRLDKNDTDHQKFENDISNLDQDIEDLKDKVSAIDSQYDDLDSASYCFANGRWYNDLPWDNDQFWSNQYSPIKITTLSDNEAIEMVKELFNLQTTTNND